ncbi:hypothetical protein [uncultured Shimia sp.]|uniref:hypothetical protein n=1 Tax=uncultured Shimia sp. TaxID=573152 RepID=UPI00261271D0|nr:hypothetical protein [uncultured Shimia sp.]
MNKYKLLSAALATCLGTASFAQVQTVPANCEAMVTIHRESCMVSNYVRCGSVVEVHSYENGKLSDSHYFGPDWDLLRYQAEGGRTDASVVEGSAPEASLTQALETGESLGTREMAFSTGVLKGNMVDLKSELRFGDEEVQISGETYRVGTLVRDMTVRKNGVVSLWSFQVLAAPDASLLIEGQVDVEQFGKVQTLAWTPTKIVGPDETGFMTTQPLPGCSGS